MWQIQDTLSTTRLRTSSKKGITPGRVQIDRNPFDRLLPFSPGGVLPYQSGEGVPSEPHGTHGDRERNQEILGHQERMIEQFI